MFNWVFVVLVLFVVVFLNFLWILFVLFIIGNLLLKVMFFEYRKFIIWFCVIFIIGIKVLLGLIFVLKNKDN